MQHCQRLLRNEAATLGFGKALARATFASGYASTDLPAPGAGVPSCGGIIYLQGDLGAGKTTLARGFLRGFGYQGAVKSPTYTLVEPYEFELCNIYHFDLYRLAAAEEVNYLGTEVYFSGDNLCLIEWPERGQGVIPEADLSLVLLSAGRGRELNCHAATDKGVQIAQRLWGKGRRL
jgi:tRNA threonylcarbamoyladenosine biosynthesis protein TsaE